MTDPRDKPPTPEQLAQRRSWLKIIGWTDNEIERALHRQELARQERVRRSLASHGLWGGER